MPDIQATAHDSMPNSHVHELYIQARARVAEIHHTDPERERDLREKAWKRECAAIEKQLRHEAIVRAAIEDRAATGRALYSNYLAADALFASMANAFADFYPSEGRAAIANAWEAAADTLIDFIIEVILDYWGAGTDPSDPNDTFDARELAEGIVYSPDQLKALAEASFDLDALPDISDTSATL